MNHLDQASGTYTQVAYNAGSRWRNSQSEWV